MKKLIATTMTAAMLLTLAACSDKPAVQSSEASAPATQIEASSEATVNETGESETAAGAMTPAGFTVQDWMGEWDAETEEHFDIYEVNDNGFKMHFYHFEEGTIEKFDYEMEFDNDEKTVASEVGTADDHGGWEYTLTLNNGVITVQWKDQQLQYFHAE